MSLSKASVRAGLLGVMALLVITPWVLGAAQQAYADPNPCSAVASAPKPPIEKPDPDISGQVLDDSDAAISGATLELFRCAGSSAVSQGTTTTNVSGQYSFDDLTPEYYYYVEAEMSGPLAGMSPAAGYQNPTDAVGLGDSVTDLEFVFE